MWAIPPCDRKVNGVAYYLLQVTPRFPRRLCISADATIVIGELVVRLYNLTIKLDDIGVLKY